MIWSSVLSTDKKSIQKQRLDVPLLIVLLPPQALMTTGRRWMVPAGWRRVLSSTELLEGEKAAAQSLSGLPSTAAVTKTTATAMGTPPPSTPSPLARHPSQATYRGTQRHAPPPWQPHTGQFTSYKVVDRFIKTFQHLIESTNRFECLYLNPERI